MNSKDLRNIASVYEAVYGGKKEEKKDTRMVVTAADKKANTKAYQNYKSGNKAYKAADHLGEGHSTDTKGKKNCGCGQNPCVTYGKQENVKESKKADKDYDGDGKIESGTDEYMGSKDKAIKKAMGKEVKDLQKAAETGKGKYVAKADKVKGVGESRWWDVSKEDMIEGYGKKKGKKKGHDCASKVKHEEYGVGNCITGMHTLDENNKVTHYDVEFEEYIVENCPVEDLEILEGMYHEHAINDEKNKQLQEKQKDTPDQVAAVIDMYRSKKGTGEAVKDTEKGDKKAAKKERDYAAFEREKMKKDDPDWKHKKGSTTESVDAEYIETVQKVKAAELEADIKRWGALEESGKFTKEEIEALKEADLTEVYILDEIDDDLLQFVESSLGNFPEDEILDMMESMWHRRNPGKKHPLESGSSKVKRRPVSDAEKKSTDKSDRMYVAMRRVKDRQKGYSRDKSDAADRLHSTYTDRQSKRKAGASSKEAAAQSHGEFGGKGFRIKRGGRSGKAPATDRGTGNKAARRAGQEVRDTRKK